MHLNLLTYRTEKLLTIDKKKRVCLGPESGKKITLWLLKNISLWFKSATNSAVTILTIECIGIMLAKKIFRNVLNSLHRSCLTETN